jgi:predicted Zn-dependent protease
MADSISSPLLTTDPTTLIPTYGLWCGPNWSAGQRDNTMTHDQLENSPVQMSAGSDGILRYSPVDELCKTHDIAYADAKGASNESSLITQADMALLIGIHDLPWSSLNATEKKYAKMMATAFVAKLAIIDRSPLLSQADTLMNEIVSIAGTPNGSTYTDSFNTTMTCDYTDPEHENLVCVVSGKTTTIETAGTSEAVDIKGTGYEEKDSVSSSGATTSTISGNGDAAVLNDATVTIAAGATATVTGDSNTINAGASSHVTVGGDGATSPTIDTINISNGTVTIENDSRVDVHGNADVVTAGNYDNFGVYGDTNTVNQTATDAVWIGTDGFTTPGYADTVNASSGTVTMTDNSRATVSGANGTIIDGAFDWVYNYAASETVNANGYNDYTANYADNVTTNVNGGGSDTLNYGNNDITNNNGSADVTYDYGEQDHNFNFGSYDSSWGGDSSDTNYNENGTDHGGGYEGYGYGGYYGGYIGGYGLAGKKGTAALGIDIGPIAKNAQHAGNALAAAAAEQAKRQIQEVASSGAASVLSGNAWNSNTITWSLATQGSAFSAFMNAKEESVVKTAFDAWAKASNLNFVEVADSPDADIRVGFGDFDTSATGIVGYTNYRASKGAIHPGAVIRVEDFSDTPLSPDANGVATYDGTDATFLQTLEHEIGHALGLATDADPNSIEYYELNQSNRSIGTGDLGAINQIYRSSGHSNEVVARSQQLVQAMSTFMPASAAMTSISAEQLRPASLQLYRSVLH